MAGPIHQTVRFADYDLNLQRLAAELFQELGTRLAPARLIQHDGSYSVSRPGSDEIAAKVVIFETRHRKGNWNPGRNGVYFCVRTEALPTTEPLTVGFLPNPHDRFAFLPIEDRQTLVRIADFIAAVAEY